MMKSITSLLSKQIVLPDSLENLNAVFNKAKPFPHVIIDNMFSSMLLEQLVGEVPSLADRHWVHEDDEHMERYNLRSAVDLGEFGFQLTAFLHSAAFLYFLSELTGIWELLPDPYLQGGGYHMIPVGGKFDIHSDRNTAYETGLIRRLSLIIYLNKDWKPEYGGQFELWNSNGTQRETVVEPLFNRTVIFEIADGNYHGVPRPVACPPGRSRNSFLVYYHTAAANGGKNVAPHTSLYAPSFYRSNRSKLGSIVKDVTPPVLLRALKSVRKRTK
jgi:Rps23 Pro-64 3,4-dihydroxylase Tpa1-like proline 4-hydroxylase